MPIETGSVTPDKRLSMLALWLAAVIMVCCTVFYYPRYRQPSSNVTLAWDAGGYYMYLPATFIYQDLKSMHWGDTLLPHYHLGPSTARDFGHVQENGNVVLQYSSGLAFAELPFFLLAHALAQPLGYRADGFSLPYQAAIQFGALLVSILGLYLLRRFLIAYYSDKVVAALLLLYVIGSNYLNYTAIDGALSHAWLFTLYCGLLLCTRSFYEKPSVGKAVAIGALCGWATLIRPTDIIACLIPLLWGLESLRPSVLAARMHFFRVHAVKLLLAFVIATLICLIQPLYWKYVSGHWFVYSYGDQGFSWTHPHILAYSLSYRSGWLVYTPLMFFALIGFLPFLKNGTNKVMTLVFSGVAFYIVSAWDIWWYAGSGGRAMIQYYPVLALPFAALLTWMGRQSWRKYVLWPFLVLAGYVNIWFTYHAHRGSLYDADDGMTRAYFWRVIGRWDAPENTLALRDGEYLYEGPLPADAQLLYTHPLRLTDSNGADKSLSLNSIDEHSPSFGFAFKPGKYKWLRAEVTFHAAAKEWTNWKMHQFILGCWKGSEPSSITIMRPHRMLSDNQTRRLSVDLRVPPDLEADSVKVSFWNPGSEHLLQMEDLKVWGFK